MGLIYKTKWNGMRIELAPIFGSAEKKKQKHQRKLIITHITVFLGPRAKQRHQQRLPSERKKSYFRANTDCHRQIVSHTISVVFYSHIAAHISLSLQSAHISHAHVCVCVCAHTWACEQCISISVLSRTNHNLIPMNNVCTKAWIWIHIYSGGQKNTCSIVQFILHTRD